MIDAQEERGCEQAKRRVFAVGFIGGMAER
jgi:hypothetical protein